MKYTMKHAHVMNHVGTDAEYKKEGFTISELSLIRKHDILFNIYMVSPSEKVLEQITKIVNLLEL